MSLNLENRWLVVVFFGMNRMMEEFNVEWGVRDYLFSFGYVIILSYYVFNLRFF